MPAAIAVPIAGWLGGTAFAVGVATVVSYAIVGAAIGAISAMVMGGSIGKGALYGAIGGAVMGGFSVAMSATAQTAISTGSTSMAAEGYTQGMVGMETVQAATTNVMTGANGAWNVGEGIAGGVGSTSQAISGGLLSGETGGWLSSQASGQALAGVAQGGLGWLAKKDEIEAANATNAQNQTWQAEQAALDRENRLKLAEISAGGGSGGQDALALAKENNRAAMERQQQQQQAEEGMRSRVRGEKMEDRASFGQSVVSASEQFKAKTGQIKSFLNTPEWLQPFKQSTPQLPQMAPISPDAPQEAQPVV